MKRSLYLLSIFLMIGFLSGCASMSKKECINADWHTIGFTDGSRGVHYTNLSKHRKSCIKYEIIPDEDAYHSGWDQGIRSYCTTDNGYRAGRAGKAYQNICPSDVEANFLSGWEQGIRQFCTPDNGLRLGLSGRQYRGVCPAELEPAFHDYYRLGRDVHHARAVHSKAEHQVHRVEKSLAAEQDPHKHRNLLHELERFQHEEERQDGILISLEACMSDDWFDAGYRDGESGYSARARDIGNVCRNYGIGADRRGYQEGWYHGNDNYCSYQSGLYVGQTNQAYSGVCSGLGHRHFWRGYEEGRHLYREGLYKAHPKPAKRKGIRRSDNKRSYDKRDQDVRQFDREKIDREKIERKKIDRSHDSRNREMRQPAEYNKVIGPVKKSEKEYKKDIKKIEVHDNRNREMRQPAEHSKAADPVEKRGIKEVHKAAEKRPAVKSNYRNDRHEQKQASDSGQRVKVKDKHEKEDDESEDEKEKKVKKEK
ncbi:MAG: DUF2799 domain-containing protein [Mariprofundaceae bacterium]